MTALLALTALLLLAAVRAYRAAKQREAADPAYQRERARDRVMRESADDDPTCQMCHRVSKVRELVMLYDDAALCCLACAELTKIGRVTRQEKAA